VKRQPVRNDGTPALRRRWSRFEDDDVRFAIRIVDTSGILERVDKWRHEDRDRLGRHAGGAPQRFPERALLVAMLLAALDGAPLLATSFMDILWRRIATTMRAELDVEEPPFEHDDRAWLALYRCVRTRLHGLLAPIDPSPLPKNRRVDAATFDKLVERRRMEQSLTEEILAERRDRLAWVANTLLEASLAQMPRWMARQWTGSVALDATNVPAFARRDRRAEGKGPYAKRRLIKQSSDPDAGPYVRTGTPTRANTSRAGTRTLDEFVWAYEATIVVSGSIEPGRGQEFPVLVVGMAPLHKPGTAISHAAITALGSIVARQHPTGWLAADRAYTNAVANDFQLPARALGYDLVLDYRDDQLGIQGSCAGAVLIEGTFYCPCVPPRLANATVAYRANRIDSDTWQAHLEARGDYQLRPKSRPDAEGHLRMLCPASDGAPTARCELKPRSIERTDTSVTRILVVDAVRGSPPTVCTQQSVTIPPEAVAKLRQTLPYGTPEWAAIYHRLRNGVEGLNGIAKDGAYSAIGDPTRRRIRGIAAQTLFIALALTATNLNQIISFLNKSSEQPDGARRKPRKRRRHTAPLADWAPNIAEQSGAPPN
jgi:hypothetical protein